jgi:hypothetical protein
MACLSAEQLAQAALHTSDEHHTAHAQQCAACRAKLAELRQWTQRISAAHADADRGHAASRSALLARLSQIDAVPWQFLVWRRLRHTLAQLTRMQRIAAGGLGLSTAAGLFALVLIIVNSATSLSAMERMVRQLREVSSYSYKLSETNKSKPGAPRHPLIRHRIDTTSWEAPHLSQPEMLGAMRAQTKIVHSQGAQATAENTRTTVHIEEIYPSGKPGIFIDHLAKTFFRTPAATAEGVPADSPLKMLEIVREESGDVVADLGTRHIGDKLAHGYAIQFKRAIPFRTLDSVEVWVDPNTDLPMQFSYTAENEWQSEVFTVYDCRWNTKFDRDRFNPTPPQGYDDITPPNDRQAIDDIAAALKLYAKLSGGHYPRMTEFNADAVREEMLKLAGFTGPPQQDWKNSNKFQQIEQATAGLNWIEHIRRRQHHSGYYGTAVGPRDNDKALLWWTVDAGDGYRVVYGDLRSELLSVEEWAALVPTDVAEGHLPVE